MQRLNILNQKQKPQQKKPQRSLKYWKLLSILGVGLLTLSLTACTPAFSATVVPDTLQIDKVEIPVEPELPAVDFIVVSLEAEDPLSESLSDIKYCVDEQNLRDLHERELLLKGRADILVDLLNKLQTAE